MLKRLLIIAHAPSPNTALLRTAALRGASSAGAAVELRMLPPLEAGPADVLPADALILGTPENLGYMSGALKDFFDRSYYPLLEAKHGLPFAAWIRARHDGTGTRRAILSITGGLRWRAVQEPLVLKGEWQPGFEARCEELGAAMAAGLEAGVF